MTKISGEEDLENTYKLASTADVVDYDRGFATCYHTSFVQEMVTAIRKSSLRPT